MSRNTKIVATYGPAVAGADRVAGLISAGADVIRLNFSHGNKAEHEASIRTVREVSERIGRPVAILQDLRGPKIRIGQLRTEPIELAEGQTIVLVSANEASEPGVVPVEGYPTLSQDVRPGQAILLCDGAIRLEVTSVEGAGIHCTVRTGGEIASRKGVNFPETRLKTLQTITEKDREDLEFGLAQGVDWIALSFVRGAGDVRQLQELIHARGASTPVIAKIEKREALRNLAAIVDAADGVMVARGDLGVETELEEVVLRQKEIIRECNRRGKVVITATQMLESMMSRPTPTRAEVSDVSNAIFDGTDALMLSGETSIGSYPVETVAFMARTAEMVEESLDVEHQLARRPFLNEVSDAVAHAACLTAHEIAADALICLTRSGLTARLVSRYRPACPVVAVSPEPTTVRRMTIQWGVMPVHLPGDLEGEALVTRAMERAREAGFVAEGNRVVITAGVSAGALRGKTNLIRVELL